MTAAHAFAWWCLVGFGSATLLAVVYWRTHPGVGFWRSLFHAQFSPLLSWVWLAAGSRALGRRLRALPPRARATRLVGAGVGVALILLAGVSLASPEDTGRVASEKVARDAPAEVLGTTEVRGPSPG